MNVKQSNFGKCRVYYCICGRVCFRPLRNNHYPCKCGTLLDRILFVISDAEVSIRNRDYAGKVTG
jgi:hypothetical protein